MTALSLVDVAFCLLAAWSIKTLLGKVVSVRRALQALPGDCPGGSILWLHPFRTLAIVAGPFFPLKGRMGYYYAKFAMFKRYQSTCLSSVTFWDCIPTFWLSDADAIKAISTDRAVYLKDVEAYETLNIYGENIVGTEGSDWKRHRTIAKPAFNEANHAFVWLETIRVINGWFADIDSKRKATDHVAIDLVADLSQVTLLVISSAGFGRRASWSEDSSTEPPPGHKIAFRPAVSSAIGHLIIKILTPNWIYDWSDYIHIPLLTPALKETRVAFDALRAHMLDVVSLARAWVSGGKAAEMDAALLRNLVEANMAQEGHFRSLSDEELLSNMFVFLLAGHETSAHSLSFALALLALYPNVQQKVYEEASRLWPNGTPTTAYKESMPNLEYTAAVFHETLRLFPPVARLAKLVNSDTTVTARRFASSPEGRTQNVEEFGVKIKAGSMVVLDIFGLHMNPIHWGEDVAEFNPERFIDTDTYRWPRDAFMAFSAGARSCIGQRFALTESICILANVVRQYEILVPENLAHKTHAEQKEALLQWTPGVTIKPTNAHVRFRRRRY